MREKMIELIELANSLDLFIVGGITLFVVLMVLEIGFKIYDYIKYK